MKIGEYFKKEESDRIWWAMVYGQRGRYIFSFDKKKNYDLFHDYPYNLTNEEKDIFDKENPFWAEFFKDRK